MTRVSPNLRLSTASSTIMGNAPPRLGVSYETLTRLLQRRRKNAFTSLGKQEHGLRRRRTAALYSKSAIMHSRHLREVSKKIVYDRLQPELEAVALACGKADGLDLSYRICTDYLSSFIFGYSNGTDYLSQHQTEIDRWRMHYENSAPHASFYPQETPGLYTLFKKASIELLPKSSLASKEFLEDWVTGMATNADQATGRESIRDSALASADEPVVYLAAKKAVMADSPELSEEEMQKEVLSEMFDHICMKCHSRSMRYTPL